jgi:uncharacterized protein YecE (DUF72 family)
MSSEPASPRDERRSKAEILIGTSGYSFADWVGPFYPKGTPPAGFLDFYARQFPALEVNTTYYAVPEPALLERMARRTPAGYHFVVKLHRSMTHERSLDATTLRQFLDAIRPLKDAGKFDGVLAQFPGGYRRTPGNRHHLAALREALAGEPLFVEFRHDSWLTPELEPSLRRFHIGYCAVDEPALPGLLPPLALLTSEDAYVRFHGRNQAQWWGGGAKLRYDYGYSKEELAEWVRKIGELADLARRVYLFFNNCHAGQAARSAKLMQELLRQQGMGV